MKEMSDTTKEEEGSVGLNPSLAAALLENQISEPKSSQEIFTLPCGYIDEEGALHTELKVREITGHEEDMLANRKMAANQKINALIAQCTERVGTVTDKGKLTQVVLDMTVGDRLFAIFAIRRVTVGNAYTFEARCSHCKHTGRFTVDLSELEIKPMPDPAKRSFEVTLPSSGDLVKFHPMIGREEMKLQQIDKKGTDSLSLAIIVRLDEVGGKTPTLGSVKNLNMKDRQFIRSKFDEVEGGVETGIELDCSSCYQEFKQELDVGQASFFFPSETQEG
jgi:hypothetical protein